MEFGIPIHHSGTYKGLPNFEESLVQLKEGRRTNLVADILIHDSSGGHLCRSHIRRQQFILQAEVPSDISKVTILNAKISHPRGPVCIVDDQAAILLHHPTQASDLFRLVETCTGLGSLGCGAEFAGFKVVARNDLQKNFCDHLKRSPGHDSSKVYHGDICKLETMKNLHAMSDGAKALAFGFSCQPFSSLGDMKEGDDDRSSTLSVGLYCGYLLQMVLIVMECTPKAPTSRFVKVCLQYFEEVTGFTKSEALLELADIWPAHRRRWWCILNNPAFGKIHINCMPRLSKPPVISDLLPAFLQLQPDTYAALRLSPYERQCCQQFSKGPLGNMVDFHNPLDTALHSWGNQCGECQCGCGRKFSQTRLKEHGIFGALVKDVTQAPEDDLRHLSAQEMAILCGFPLKYGWDANPRFLTAGVGQLASSLQSAWVFGQIRRHLFHLKFGGLSDCKPKEILACVCAELFAIRDSLFPQPPTVAMELFREAIETMLFPPDHEALAIRPVNCLDITVQPEQVPPSDTVHDQGALVPVADSSVSSVDINAVGFDTATVPSSPSVCIAQEVTYLSDHWATEIAVSPQEVSGTMLEIWDPKTGGCKPFAVPAYPAELIQPKQVEVETSKRNFQSRSAPQAVQVVESRKRELSTVLDVTDHESSRSAIKDPCRGIYPLELVDEHAFLVWDPDADNFYTINCDPNQTVGDFLTADQTINALPEQRNLFDAVGQLVPRESFIAQIQWGTVAVAPTASCLALPQRTNWLRSKHRLIALMNRGGAVAVDEMEFYLTAIKQSQKVGMLSPLVLSYMLDLQSEVSRWMQSLSSASFSITAVLIAHHWIPFVICPQNAGFKVFSTAEGVKLGSVLFPGLVIDFQVLPDIPPQFTDGCGFQALAVVLSVITGTEAVPFSRSKASAWHHLFWQRIYVSQQTISETLQVQLGAAHSSELDTAVATLLREHGVATDQVVDRAKQVITRLGASSIQNALQSDWPWPALKALANSSSPPIRLIQPAEFQQVVKQRTRTDRQIKSKKQPKVSSDKPVQFVPTDLVIPEGVFCQMPDGHPLAHLTIRQVHPKAKGVVLCSEAEVQPFLSQSCISSEGLAFLVMAPFSKQIEECGVVLRFPAQSIATIEPVLLTAVLIQKGIQAVQRSVPPTQLQVDQVPTRTMKLFLYRDQTNCDWNEVVKKPVKCLLETLQCLQQCKQDGCTCPKWHEGEHEPLLDVWQRSFLTVHFTTVKPVDSALFTCAVRVIEGVASQLFDLSGTNGIYVEPRTHDGKQHDLSTQTVWLPKHSYQQAIAAKSTASVPTSLIRVGHRYGLRAITQDAPKLHSQFRPDVPYLPGATKEEFLVGPLPWGTTRVALVKLFASWEWIAKPLQPAGRSADSQGLMWLVHAMKPPTNSVYTMVHGDELVVKHTQSPQQDAKMPAVEASRFTKKQLRASDEEWDPWASAAAKLPQRTEVSQAQLQSIQASLEQKLTAKLSRNDGDADMEPGMEGRLTALEAQVQSLQQVQQKQHTQTVALTSKVDQIQSDLDVQSSKFQSHLDDKLSEQMQRIEALFAKRPRQEWQTGPRKTFSSCGWPFRAIRSFLVLICLVLQLRIGEASTPGPVDQWGLGVVNVNGIQGKAAQFSDLPAGIFAVSESHLTTPGQHKFQEEIRSIKLSMKWTGGAPAPFKGKSLSSVGGKHTGVGFMTSFPFRAVSRGWSPDLYSTGRIHAASFYVGPTWITGGVCYGYASQSESQQVKNNTQALLAHLSDVVLHSVPGPKFLAGDFNQLEGQLPITQQLELLGWQEIQNFAYRHWQILPGPTCQHKTRKDFRYLSPDLQQHILQVSNQFDRFPDHSTLMAMMSFPCPLPREPRWHMVTPIDYQTLPIDPRDMQQVPVRGTLGDQSSRLTAIFQTFEDQIHHHCVALGHSGLSSKQFGRTASRRRQFVCPSFSPLKASRPGEPVPGLAGESLKHKRWFTQLRRLIAYRNLVKVGRTSPNALEHKVSLWHSIVFAPGFTPSFAQWWNYQGYLPLPTCGSSVAPCDLSMADYLVTNMEKEVRTLEKVLQQARQSKAKIAHHQDVNRIFREVRKPGPVPVQALVAKQQSVVIEAPDAGTVIVNECSFDISLPIHSSQGVHHAHMIEDGQIWFDVEHSLAPGDSLIQTEPIGSIQALHDAFAQEWKARWDRHNSIPFTTWDPINDVASSLLPSQPMQCEDITIDQWKNVIRKKKAKSAIGMDSVSRADLLAFPDWLHQHVVDLVNHAEHTGQWPYQMLQGSVHALEKCPNADQVGQFRPITVMPLLFRCWGSLRSKQVLSHVTQIAPPELLGNIPGRTAMSLWWKLQAQIEHSLYAAMFPV